MNQLLYFSNFLKKKKTLIDYSDALFFINSSDVLLLEIYSTFRILPH